jgi:hypothetical protein
MHCHFCAEYVLVSISYKRIPLTSALTVLLYVIVFTVLIIIGKTRGNAIWTKRVWEVNFYKDNRPSAQVLPTVQNVPIMYNGVQIGQPAQFYVNPSQASLPILQMPPQGNGIQGQGAAVDVNVYLKAQQDLKNMNMMTYPQPQD